MPEPTCPKYLPKEPGNKVCDYYLSNGSCELPSEFMCTEWSRRFEGVVKDDVVQVRRKS